MHKMIDKNMTIEELVETYPQAIQYLSEKGIRCIRCGEPVWGTIESAAREKGFTSNEIDTFVRELNEIVR
jgi:methionine synthase II (cobalamin-independent)